MVVNATDQVSRGCSKRLCRMIVVNDLFRRSLEDLVGLFACRMLPWRLAFSWTCTWYWPRRSGGATTAAAAAAVAAAAAAAAVDARADDPKGSVTLASSCCSRLQPIWFRDASLVLVPVIGDSSHLACLSAGGSGLRTRSYNRVDSIRVSERSKHCTQSAVGLMIR